ncbi:MAG TPA: gamma-glutamyl-gamma-aminobutyrate hydrolase family protein [Solirubrobacteraceae bacterium]|nr:gamma-glutamyl-gamma-aminobutyrate hydrolase family protein [Solirubrobacteraceae bacterium]
MVSASDTGKAAVRDWPGWLRADRLRWAPDGAIEALEDPDRRFALCVLWHPEQGEDRRLFAALVRAAGGVVAPS